MAAITVADRRSRRPAFAGLVSLLWLAACGSNIDTSMPADTRQASDTPGTASPAAATGSGAASGATGAAAATGSGGSSGAVGTAGAAATGGASATGTAGAPSGDAAFIEQAVKMINDARAVARNCGTAAYAATGATRWNADAAEAATTQATYLQQNNLFSHTGANGSSVGDRLTAAGYVWSTVGENIAAGYPDMASVVKGWLDSPGHCVNMMNPNFVDVGLALVPGTSSNSYRTYWALVLAKPR